MVVHPSQHMKGQVKEDHISLLTKRYSAPSLIRKALWVCASARLIFQKTMACACKLAVGVLNRQNAGKEERRRFLFSGREPQHGRCAQGSELQLLSVEDKNM